MCITYGIRDTSKVSITYALPPKSLFLGDFRLFSPFITPKLVDMLTKRSTHVDQNFGTSQVTCNLTLYQFTASKTSQKSLKWIIQPKSAQNHDFPRFCYTNLTFCLIYIFITWKPKDNSDNFVTELLVCSYFYHKEYKHHTPKRYFGPKKRFSRPLTKPFGCSQCKQNLVQNEQNETTI